MFRAASVDIELRGGALMPAHGVETLPKSAAVPTTISPPYEQNNSTIPHAADMAPFEADMTVPESAGSLDKLATAAVAATVEPGETLSGATVADNKQDTPPQPPLQHSRHSRETENVPVPVAAGGGPQDPVDPPVKGYGGGESGEGEEPSHSPKDNDANKSQHPARGVVQVPEQNYAQPEPTLREKLAAEAAAKYPDVTTPDQPEHVRQALQMDTEHRKELHVQAGLAVAAADQRYHGEVDPIEVASGIVASSDVDDQPSASSEGTVHRSDHAAATREQVPQEPEAPVVPTTHPATPADSLTEVLLTPNDYPPKSTDPDLARAEAEQWRERVGEPGAGTTYEGHRLEPGEVVAIVPLNASIPPSSQEQPRSRQGKNAPPEDGLPENQLDPGAPAKNNPPITEETEGLPSAGRQSPEPSPTSSDASASLTSRQDLVKPEPTKAKLEQIPSEDAQREAARRLLDPIRRLFPDALRPGRLPSDDNPDETE